MARNNPIYEGKAKILYEGSDPGTLIQYFKDDVTAGNGDKHEVMPGKGVLNNRISEFLMTRLDEIGIHTHFLKSINMREQLIKACDVVPIEVVVRNVTAGSLATRFGVEEGMLMPQPLVEYYLKSDKLGDPMITEEHIVSFEWALEEELEAMRNMALRANDFLSGLFMGADIKLVDIKLEFGRIYDEEGNLYLVIADEISPDSCRLWDAESGDKLDKDVFRRDLGSLMDVYREVAKRLGVIGDDMSNVESLIKEEKAAGSAGKAKPKKAGKEPSKGRPANKNTKPKSKK